MLDAGNAPGVFYGAAGALVFGVASAALVGIGVAARSLRAPATVAG